MMYSINFICRQTKAGKNGEAPVEMTISCQGTRVFMQLPMKVMPSVFKKEASKKNSPVKNLINLFEVKAQKAAMTLLASDTPLTAQSIKDLIINKPVKKYTIQDLCNDYLKWLRQKIDIDITFENYKKYYLIPKLIYKVINPDAPIDQLTVQTANEYILYIQQNFRNETVKHKIAKFKTILKWGRDNGRFIPDIFSGIKVKINRPKERKYLTTEELSRIEEKDFGIDRLNKIKDMFIFQCYSGMAFKDMSNLCKTDIHTDDNGRQYITKERAKTGITYTVLLLPKAIEILEKYDYKLPCCSNVKMNAYLKEIADVCHIPINLHSHCGRHTAATMFLNAGLSIEVVAKILGHSSTRITQQTYAKMLDKTVINAMATLNI